MNRILTAADRLIGGIMIVLISLMLVIGSAQVFCRYMLHSSLSWSEELMRFLYVWIVMIGINLGIRHKSMAAINSLSDFIGAKSVPAGYALSSLCFFIQLFICIILFYFGLLFVIASKQVSPALGIPMSCVYLAIPLGGGMGVMYTLDQMIAWYKTARKNKG